MFNNFLFRENALRNLLKFKRWEAGIRQYDLAGRLGCSAPYLSMVENGRIEPSEEFMLKAAQELAVEVNELFPKTRVRKKHPANGEI